MKYVDMHSDTITKLLRKEDNGESSSLLSNNLHIDITKLKKSGYLIQNFAIFTPVNYEEKPQHFAFRAIDKFYREIDANRGDIQVIRKYEDIAKDKINALLTIEDISIIYDDLALLRILYRLGVRMVGLTWNFKTSVGYPNIDMSKGSRVDIRHTDKVNGLTDFGKEIVKECERLGIIVDVSHLSDKGFWDVYDLSAKPFVASHSNARMICDVARNLDDEMIKALHYKGGVMGINFCKDFISDSGSVKDIIRHIDHIKEVAGIDVIGLGSDFDGIEDRDDLKDASCLNELSSALYEHGYKNEEIEKMMYGNVLRVYKDIL